MTTTYRPTGPPTVRGDEWYAETRRDETALAELSDDWDSLYERCSMATPFASHAWLSSWWANYGRPGRLVLVLVRWRGRLVAAAALTRTRLGALTPLGAGISDHSDVLIDDSCPGAAHRLARELAAAQRWRPIDLREVPTPAAARRLLETWPARTWRLPGSMCLELPAMSIEDLIGTLPPSTARTRRKKSRKIETAGFDHQEVPAADVADAIRTLLRLHRAQWRGRDLNPEHVRARFAEHLTRALPAMVDRGQAVVMEYRTGDEVVAVHVLLLSHRAVCAYLYGVDPELRHRIDIAQLLLGTNLALAVRLGRPALNLLRGDEPYKRRWRPRSDPNERLLLAGSAVLPSVGFAAAVRGRYALVRFVKGRMPWLGQLMRRRR